jgi:hypothetical protein
VIERVAAWSRSCLTMQGYGALDDRARRQRWLGIRFAPAVTTTNWCLPSFIYRLLHRGTREALA